MSLRARWCAAAACAGLTVVVCGAGGLLLSRLGTPGVHPAPAAPVAWAALPEPTTASSPGPGHPRAVPVARPAALSIPEIGVRTALVTLGLTAQGAVQVPATTSVAGWYDGSPRPGSVGPAVILGHIDSYQGPGVFFRLAGLSPGDPVYVRRSDGSTVEFVVTAVRSYRKSQFPTEAVYGPVPDAELRLITCGGVFDSDTGHYLSNVVVFATEAG